MEINAAGLPEIEVIRHIACLTWPLAYADILSPGQLNYMLRQMYSYEQLKEQMTAPDHAFYVSYNNSKPTGFVNVSKVAYEVPGKTTRPEVWKLHKLYVVPAAQKTGAGSQLLQQAITTIQSRGGNYLILNVNRENPAYHYYLKQGFEVLESGDFDIGAGFYMNDYVMGKAL